MSIYIGIQNGPPEPDVEGVAKALKTLQKEEVNIGNSKIEKIEQSARHSHNERKGIDFKIILANGVMVPLKVKASPHAERRFRKQGRMRPFQIPVIVARSGCKMLHSIIYELVNILKAAANTFKRLRDHVIYVERRRKHTGGRIIRNFCRA